MKYKIVFFCISISGICWSCDALFGYTNSQLSSLQGAVAQCNCQTCANKTRRKDECFYNSSIENPTCSTESCTVTRHYWGQCPDKTGGAACPLKRDGDLYKWKIEYKDGPPSDCSTASNAKVNGPASTECGPHGTIEYRCVISSQSCGGTVTGTTEYYGEGDDHGRSVCDI